MRVKSNKTVALIISLIIALSGLILVGCPQKLSAQSLEDELEQVKDKREETEKKIEEARETEKIYITEVSLAEDQLLGALSELDDLNNQLTEAISIVEKTSVTIALKEEDLTQIKGELIEKNQILSDRVISIYKRSNDHILELLLDVKNFIEFTSGLKLINLIAKQDNEVVHKIREKRNAVESIKKIIIDLNEKQEDHKRKTEVLVIKAEQKTSEIETLYSEKKILLSQTRSNKEALINMEKELKEKEADLTRILESYRYGTAPSGKLAWPVPAHIISGFSNRIHPTLGVKRFHAGIDLDASYGTPVKAAEGGKVIQAGHFGGYGYSVMIYHGGGFATWYAHLSSINASMGQYVQRGQIIGMVGSTGWSTGPHLHFEVRINGAPQNPLGYL